MGHIHNQRGIYGRRRVKHVTLPEISVKPYELWDEYLITRVQQTRVEE